MNESLEYEKMIEIPSSSCEYVHKRFRRILKKRKIIKNVNAEIEKSGALLNASAGEAGAEQTGLTECSAAENENREIYENRAMCENCADKCGDDACGDFCDNVFERDESHSEKTQKTGKVASFFKNLKNPEKRGDRIITAQIAAVFLLVIAIILTNVFWENSGMNTLFKSVFGVTQKQTDNRVYSDFSLNLPVKGEGLTYTEGVINVTGETFIYPVCEGKISKIEKSADGKYTVTVSHSDTFKSVIEGADFVCFEVGEKVNSRVPLCHTQKGASIYLYDGSSLLTEYAAKEDSIVWNK